MPTNIKYFRDFSKGIISNIDDNDIPEDALYYKNPYYTVNAKVDAIGKLKGVNDLSPVVSNHAEAFYNSGWLSRIDKSYSLVYSRLNTIKYIPNFYSTPDVVATTIYTASGFDGNAIEHNNSLHVGAGNNKEPVYIAEVNNYIFQGKAKATPSSGTINDALNINTENVSATVPKTIRLQISTASGNIQENLAWSNTGTTVTVTVNDITGITVGNTIHIMDSFYYYHEYGSNVVEGNINGDHVVTAVVGSTFSFVLSTAISVNASSKCSISKGALPAFKFSDNGGGTWSSSQTIVKFKKYKLNDITYTYGGYGLEIWFDSITDLKVGDYWDISLQATTTTVIGEAAALTNYGGKGVITISPTFVNGDTANFTLDKRHYIAYSLEYDNSQTSPLYWDESQVVIPTTSTPEKLVVNISVNNTTTPISKRINAITLWHAESDTDGSEPENYFRVIKRIETNNDKWRYTTNTNIVNNTIENTGYFGASYNATTGILDTALDILPKYKLSAVLNGCLFVGDFSHPWFKHQDGMILAKSQLNSYEMFNLTEDILKLPEVPTCLYPYRGKILAFTNSNMYTINYDMYIEDIYHGVGCNNIHTITETEEGLYVANNNACYKITGQGVMEVSYPIRDIWPNATWMAYDGAERMLIAGDSAALLKFGYDVDRAAWISLSLGDDYNTNHVFQGKNQDTYMVSDYPRVYKFFAGNQLSFTIYKPITLGDSKEYKKWYQIITDGNSVTTTFRESTIGSTWNSLTNSTEVKPNGDWSKAKVLWLKIIGKELNEIAIKFRKLAGVRT